MDNKIRRIERHFKNRNDNRQKLGAGNLSQWSLEERVGATIGDRPRVHVETVSSLRKDNSKGKVAIVQGKEDTFPCVHVCDGGIFLQRLDLQQLGWLKEEEAGMSRWQPHLRQLHQWHADDPELTR